jgi:hypothetical protein
MEEWFLALSTFEKVYWIIALVSSVIFIILLILTFLGGEVDDMGDVDADIDGDTGIGFQFLSFKNLMGFFTIFGCTGISSMSAGYSNGITITISIFCGLLMMGAMATLFYYLGKLTSNGSLQIKNALHNIGEVYLTIGANRSRMGKVQINVQGSLRELEALTDEDVDLKQGDIIQVTEITTNGILIVNKHTN